jgi:hypothetical protein
VLRTSVFQKTWRGTDYVKEVWEVVVPFDFWRRPALVTLPKGDMDVSAPPAREVGSVSP